MKYTEINKADLTRHIDDLSHVTLSRKVAADCLVIFVRTFGSRILADTVEKEFKKLEGENNGRI